MQQEAADEFVGGKLHGLAPVSITIVFPPEADLLVFDIKDTIVGDRYPMSVASEVVKHFFRVGKRGLGLDDPFLVP